MQNFGKIKNAFNGILAEGVVSKNDTHKLLFKKYIKSIKESNILKTQFLVYHNLENKIEENEFKATEFVKANIEMLAKFKKNEILEANLKLATPTLFEGESNYDLEKLHENISTLIFTERTPENIDTIIEATSSVVKYIQENKKQPIVEALEMPNGIISAVMVDKYNAKYATLDESQKQILKVLIDATEEEKKTVYSNTLRECIDLIDARLSTADLEAKDKLLRVKDKLLNDKKEVNEDFAKNISKLSDLRDSLK